MEHKEETENFDKEIANERDFMTLCLKESSIENLCRN
jgi:hypothetical protein